MWTFPWTGKSWLQDFLPWRLTRTHVLLYGYNTNVAFHTLSAGIKEQIYNLLNRLKFKYEVSKKAFYPAGPFFVLYIHTGIGYPNGYIFLGKRRRGGWGVIIERLTLAERRTKVGRCFSSATVLTG
jgi:hypothetical protein